MHTTLVLNHQTDMKLSTSISVVSHILVSTKCILLKKGGILSNAYPLHSMPPLHHSPPPPPPFIPLSPSHFAVSQQLGCKVVVVRLGLYVLACGAGRVGGGAVLVWVRSEVSRSHQPWHLINKSALFLLPQFSAHVRWRYRQHPVRVTEWSATRFGYRANLESMLFRTMRSPLSPGVGFNAIRSNCWFGSF